MTRPFTPCPKPPKSASKPRKRPTRSKPLPKATGRIARHTPVVKRNAQRKGHRFPKNVNESYRAWMREQACCITGLYAGDVMPIPHGSIKVVVQPAHVKSRNSGGPDAANIVPLNQYHHKLLDQVDGPETFAAKFDVDLPALAQAYWTVWLDLQRPVAEEMGHG